MDLAKFATDGTLEQDGAWEEIGDGLRVKVASMTNTRYREYMRRLGKPFLRQMRSGTLDIETIETMNKKGVARHVLLGWEGLQIDGADIPFSAEKALEIFETHPRFFELVTDIANDADTFRNKEQEDAMGNSPNSSGGS